jgi:hypothetical protein
MHAHHGGTWRCAQWTSGRMHVLADGDTVAACMRSLTGNLVKGLASSGMAKSVVTGFGDRLLVEESIVSMDGLCPAYWAYWLANTGYTNQAGESGVPA